MYLVKSRDKSKNKKLNARALTNILESHFLLVSCLWPDRLYQLAKIYQFCKNNDNSKANSFVGFDVKQSRNLKAIQEYIDFIDQQFLLVMLTEYFDESLVLLKRLMNWSMAGKSWPHLHTFRDSSTYYGIDLFSSFINASTCCYKKLKIAYLMIYNILTLYY